jgi:hypothetical protein
VTHVADRARCCGGGEEILLDLKRRESFISRGSAGF